MLEDEQKKIITYHRIWFVRLIAMIVACQAFNWCITIVERRISIWACFLHEVCQTLQSG